MKTKNILFLILISAFILLTIGIVQANIFVLGLSELILMPTIITLFINNLKNNL